MDFSRVEPTTVHRALIADVRHFCESVDGAFGYEERSAATGFDEQVHLALGARGWIMPHWSVQDGGAGLDRAGVRFLELELARHRHPDVALRTTQNVWIALERRLDPAVRAELKPGVALGAVRLCLGYTEPEGGSDIAAARTRAVRDGDGWVISGSKAFTTAAEHAHYVFLLTRTDPEVAKHKGLTMFLVPLSAPGVEVQPIWTVGGERTNVTYYDGVRVPDRLRVGEVNGGWAVLRGPLDQEHGLGEVNGLDEISTGHYFLRYLERALDAVVAWAHDAVRPHGSRPADDPVVQAALGRVLIEMETARSAPGPFGRVAGAEALIRNASALIDLVGPEALLLGGSTGPLRDLEFAHRFAQATTIREGTVEVFRSMIAGHELGLPQMNYPGTTSVPGRAR
jgi:alkylation response protein AidB-like acyl-CoA dehydrogenase